MEVVNGTDPRAQCAAVLFCRLAGGGGGCVCFPVLTGRWVGGRGGTAICHKQVFTLPSIVLWPVFRQTFPEHFYFPSAV